MRLPQVGVGAPPDARRLLWLRWRYPYGVADDTIDLEAELDRLYRFPAGDFVAARNELVKRLRASGNREAAEAVKKRPRPSQTAWAVNQLAFRAEAELAGLRAAGEKVRAAHLAGPQEQQAAAKARRDAISSLRVIAEIALQEVGVTPNRGHQQRISQTLEVLSTQSSEDDGPRAGRLSVDLEPAGFDALTDLAAALAASQKARSSSAKQRSPQAAASPPASGTETTVASRPRSKVVKHPAAERQEDVAARRAAARRAAERRELDRQRTQVQAKLDRLLSKEVDLSQEAERSSSGLEEAKRLEAARIGAVREAERQLAGVREQAKTAADATAQARRNAEATAAAHRRAEAEIARIRQELDRLGAAARRLAK